MGDDDGAIKQELERALYGTDLEIVDYYAGVGGKDVPPAIIEKIIYHAKHNSEPVNWIDVD
jgi:pyruvate/2-oxoacid:ferredoxin oxidoreductase alpha subunit